MTALLLVILVSISFFIMTVAMVVHTTTHTDYWHVTKFLGVRMASLKKLDMVYLHGTRLKNQFMRLFLIGGSLMVFAGWPILSLRGLEDDSGALTVLGWAAVGCSVLAAAALVGLCVLAVRYALDWKQQSIWAASLPNAGVWSALHRKQRFPHYPSSHVVDTRFPTLLPREFREESVKISAHLEHFQKGIQQRQERRAVNRVGLQEEAATWLLLTKHLEDIKSSAPVLDYYNYLNNVTWTLNAEYVKEFDIEAHYVSQTRVPKQPADQLKAPTDFLHVLDWSQVEFFSASVDYELLFQHEDLSVQAVESRVAWMKREHEQVQAWLQEHHPTMAGLPYEWALPIIQKTMTENEEKVAA